MTIQLFLTLLVFLSLIDGLFTQALKKFFENTKSCPSANLMAFLSAIVIGGGGSIGAYIFLTIPFTLINCTAIVAMIFAVWIGSMIGYDKIIQLIEQINNK